MRAWVGVLGGEGDAIGLPPPPPEPVLDFLRRIREMHRSGAEARYVVGTARRLLGHAVDVCSAHRLLVAARGRPDLHVLGEALVAAVRPLVGGSDTWRVYATRRRLWFLGERAICIGFDADPSPALVRHVDGKRKVKFDRHLLHTVPLEAVAEGKYGMARRPTVAVIRDRSAFSLSAIDAAFFRFETPVLAPARPDILDVVRARDHKWWTPLVLVLPPDGTGADAAALASATGLPVVPPEGAGADLERVLATVGVTDRSSIDHPFLRFGLPGAAVWNTRTRWRVRWWVRS